MEDALRRFGDRWPSLTLLALAVAALGQVAFDIPVRGAHYFLTAWGMAALYGATYGILRPSWRRTVGMALMMVPVTMTLLSILNDLAPLLAGGRVIVPRSPYQLSSAYMYAILRRVGYVGVGYLIWSGWKPRDGLRSIAFRLRRDVPIMGHLEGPSLRAGVAWFPVLLLGTFLVDFLISSNVPQLVNNDEGGFWSRATIFHVVMISLAAAFGEELTYRVFMMGAIAASLRRLNPRTAWGIALVVQAVIFGFAHAGFGNYLHVLQATLFGFISGIAFVWLGIWAAIALHFLVDIYAIGVNVPNPIWQWFLVAALLANVVYSVYVGQQSARKMRFPRA